MRYFTYKEVLIGAAGLIWAALVVWFFAFSGRSVDDILINLITDIAFAIFVVLIVDYAVRKDQEDRQRSRRRALALSVQKFYQNFIQLVGALISDGIKVSSAKTLSTPEEVAKRALDKRYSGNIGEFANQPASYAAYFICDSNGTSPANIYPVRQTSVWLAQLANNFDRLYLDIFQIDGGLLPDQIVDALTVLKDLPVVGFCKTMTVNRVGRWDYWTQEELETAIVHISTLLEFFRPALGYQASPADEFLKDAIENSLSSNRSSN